MSYQVIDSYLWAVWSILTNKYGPSVADREIDPLRWYFQTGRDSYSFRSALLAAKPFMIARKLHMGGSYDETINRIKEYLGV